MTLPVIASPVIYDLRIKQGSTFTRACQLLVGGVAQDLTGCTFLAKLRANFNSGAALIIALSVDTSLLASGQFVLSLTAAQTLALTVPAGTPDAQREAFFGSWDLEITAPASAYTYRYAEGDCYLSRETSF